MYTHFACQHAETAFFTLQSGEQLSNIKEHTKQINDIQTSRDMTMFITASKDNTAKVRPSVGIAVGCWYLLAGPLLRAVAITEV